MSTHTCFVAITILCLASLVSCSGREDPSPLVGKWSTGIVQTEWGSAENIVIFNEESMKVRFVPESGDAISTSATYVVSSEYITSEAINGGVPMRYVVTNEVLTLTDSSSEVSILVRQ